MKIVIEKKSVYGAVNIYPVCQTAKFFASLAGTKTLTQHAVELIKRAGYEVEQKAVML
jgi:hypothetical protein